MFLAGMYYKPLLMSRDLMNLQGCVQRVITGHSPVVDDWPVSNDTEHMAEKVVMAKVRLMN